MLIDGKKIALDIQNDIKEQISRLGGNPVLAVVMVGNHPASTLYVKRKTEACERVGIKSMRRDLSDQSKEEDVINVIEDLNRNEEVDGILVQLPFPKGINTLNVMSKISPEKDVDGFHPLNMGKLLLGDKTGFVPCTPLGIQALLVKSNVNISGKHTVILGRSNIVGKPLAALLMQNQSDANATVTVAHSKTPNLQELTKSADILIAAIGSPRFVTKDMVKEGAVIIDVGINKVDGRLAGDVDFENVKDICSLISPVPGGVGPMTITFLLANTLKSYLQRK